MSPAAHTESLRPAAEQASARTTHIQRRANDIMSFASVLAFCTVGGWLLLALLFWQVSGVTRMDSSSAQELLERWHLLPKASFDGAVLSAALLLALVAAMAPIVCLRRLGKALRATSPLNLVVARRFSWLGHALLANLIGGFAARLVAATQIPQYQLSLGIGFLGTLTAATLAYVVAEMVREGTRAAEENRAFV
ncbi:MAG: hypothetical protein ACTHJO_10845 [Rhodanobacter sp.]